MLNPIRRILPSTGMIDFSPLVLLILVQVVEYILTRVLLSY
jgi:YggT family protein